MVKESNKQYYKVYLEMEVVERLRTGAFLSKLSQGDFIKFLLNMYETQFKRADINVKILRCRDDR